MGRSVAVYIDIEFGCHLSSVSKDRGDELFRLSIAVNSVRQDELSYLVIHNLLWVEDDSQSL